ncbi:hypothetical protein RUND412_000349 [Rhizina undulata]
MRRSRARVETFRMGSSMTVGEEAVVWEVAVGRDTIVVYYSSGYNALEKVASITANDNTRKGQAHVGILKLPKPPSTNASLNGFRETGIYEGLIYGGIFVEDSSS